MKTKIQLAILALMCWCSSVSYAQLADGATAPDWTLTDLEGNTYNLYDILDEGKSVVIDFMATWCGPCWSYHQTHRLKTLYEDYGPNGTDEIMVFMFEASPSTNEACLYGPSGCVGGTLGDWTEDIPYPIIHLQGSNGGSVAGNYNLQYYPTLYKICPNRKAYEVGQISLQGWINWMTSCDLAADATTSDAICYEDASAGIDLTVEGGFGNKTYSWSNGSNTEDLNGVPPGAYSCTITEGQGHSVEVGPFMVSGPDAPILINASQVVDPDCFGDDDGLIAVQVTGGEAGYAYQWNTGGNGPMISGLTGGNYTVTVTDNLGCTETWATSLNEPPLITLDGSTIEEHCDQANGSILLFAGGGNSPYTYDIGQGPTNSNIFPNLSSGLYTATVTDNSGCTLTSEYFIPNVPGPEANAGLAQSLSCSQTSIQLDGTSSTTGIGLTYEWTTNDGNITDGTNTLTPTVDQAGTYVLTVLDVVHNCFATDAVVVTGASDIPVAEIADPNTLTCANASVTLDGSPSSTGDDYTYSWTDAEDNVISEAITATTSQAGNYTLLVTNTISGCTSTESVDVEENINVPQADAGSNSTITCTETTVQIGGNSEVGPDILYTWLNSQGEEIGTGLTIVVDLPDVYELMVTDLSNGCSAIAVVTVDEDTEAPTADAGNDGTLTCENTELEIGGSSSTGSEFSYQWTDDDGNSVGDDAPTWTTDTPGTFSLEVENMANGCTSIDEVAIAEDTTVPTADAGDDDILTCTQVSVNIGGSSSNGDQFEYQWTNDDLELIGEDAEVDVESPGTYTLLVTNMVNGCTAEDMVLIEQDTQEPTADAGDDDILTCVQTSLTIGGNSSNGSVYNFQWTNAQGTVLGYMPTLTVNQPNTYTLAVLNTNNGCESMAEVMVSENTISPIADAGDDGTLTCLNSSVGLGGNSSSGSNFSYLWTDSNNNAIGTNEQIEVSTADTYQLLVTDSENGCTASATAQVDENTAAPAANAGSGGELNCNQSVVTLDGSSSSGNSQISYDWFNSNGNLVGQDATLEVSTADDYQLIITDIINGCTDEANVSVTASNDFPVAVANSSGDLTCQTSQVTLDAEGSSNGTNFTYQWLDENGDLISNAPSIEVDNSGGYSLIVSDTDNGCTATADLIINEDLASPSFEINPAEALSCDNTSVLLNADHNTTQPSYLWMDANGNTLGTTAEIEVDQAGEYSLQITDQENGCFATQAIEVSASTDLPVATAEVADELNCINAEVTIDAGASSTGANFSYNWSSTDGNISGGEQSLQPTVDAAGIYELLVTNTDNGCTAQTSVTVALDQTPPSAEIAEPQALHCNQTSLQLDAQASSSGNNFSYEWTTNDGAISNGAQSLNPTINASGTYELQITNQDNGCKTSASVVVNAIDDPSVELDNPQSISCFEGNDGQLSATATNGLAPYNYAWSNGAETATIDGLSQGNYEVIVSDQNGCTTTANYTLNQPDALDISSTVVGESAIGANDGSIDIQTSGGAGNYTYQWSHGPQTANVNMLAPGTYELSVTDQNGCARTESFMIQAFNCVLQAQAAVVPASCFGAEDGHVQLSTNEDPEGLSFSWSNGASTQSLTDVGAGSYTVVITNAFNCSETITVEVAEPSALVMAVSALSEATCDNATDGSAEAQVNGGTAPYTYQWSNGESDAVATQLPAGTQSVVITDANGCEIMQTIEIDAEDGIAPTVLTQDITIELDEDGQAAINALMIDNGSMDNCGLASLSLDQTLFDCSQLGEQTVTLTAIDNNNNITNATAIVNIVDNIAPVIICAPDMSSSSCDAIEYDLPQAMDNCSEVTYQLIEGLPSGSIFPEGTTTITYEVSDASGNSVMCSFNMEIIYTLQVSTIATDVSCFGADDGLADATASGGQAGYTYLWNDGQETPVAVDLIAGDYSVTVTDATGCTSISEVNVASPTQLELTIDEVINEEEFGEDGSISITVNGGTPPYAYTWSENGNIVSNEEDPENLIAGTYQVQITDANDCNLFSETIIVDNIVSVGNVEQNPLRVWPNPSQGLLQIEYLDASSDLSISLFHNNGQLIQNYQTQNVQMLDISHLPNGIYLLKIVVEDEVYVEKIVLEKG